MATLTIPDALHQRLKIEADRAHQTPSDIAVTLLQNALQARADFPKPPSIDWANFPTSSKPLQPIGLDEISRIVRAGRDEQTAKDEQFARAASTRDPTP